MISKKQKKTTLIHNHKSHKGRERHTSSNASKFNVHEKNNILGLASQKRIWCNGIIVPSHGSNQGSIPWMRKRKNNTQKTKQKLDIIENKKDAVRIFGSICGGSNGQARRDFKESRTRTEIFPPRLDIRTVVDQTGMTRLHEVVSVRNVVEICECVSISG